MSQVTPLITKISVTFFLCCCAHSLLAQNSNDISIGTIDYVHSEILNEQRKLLVHVPEGNPHDHNTYPVVYLLDGDAHFYSVVGMIRQLSSVNKNTILPKMIVVGISNTNRIRDLGPTEANSTNSKHGDNFMSFLEKELIPHIDSKYPTKPYRTFIGHSLGGLAVMNALLNKPHLFNSYIAIDPSMWWNNRHLLRKIKTTTFNEKYNNKTLFLGIANTMANDMNITKVQKDTSYATRHIRAILDLNTFLNNNTQKKLSFKGTYYEDDDHASVPLIATYEALRFIFDFYRFKLTEHDYNNQDINLLLKVENYYKRLSKGFGTDLKPDIYYVNNLAYTLLRKKQFKRAEQFFKLNIKNYPESSSVYESMGDFYLATGLKEKAIECYKKALTFNNDTFLKDKITALEKD